MARGGRGNSRSRKGGGGGRGGSRGGGKSNGGNTWRQDKQQDNGGWTSLTARHNDRFEGYYLDQNILPAEEWNEFLEAFRAPLPTTFRFTAGKSTTRQLINQMHDKWVPELSGVEFEGEPVAPPQQLEWYPDGLAWQIDVMKSVLRKQPAFQNFQRFLVNETEVGSISRQEAVSMIPPLFLDVKPEHLVLDMCAAPGSKTAQLIEALHSPTTSSPDHYDPCPPGLIMANDSDQKRAYMLVHQAQRLPSPNLCVTNVDASAWPKVQVPWQSGKEGEDVQPRELKFDRILGDVPCSGDGTLRKNVGIWKDWTLQNGQGLHALQLRILLRGLGALRPGGRMVYSTCSLNPLENEAVIAAALRECGADPANGRHGSVRVVDVSDHLPQLKRAKGLTSWKVAPGKGRHLFEGSAGNLRPKERADKAPAAGQGDDKEVDEDTLANGPQSAQEGKAEEAEDDKAAGPQPGSSEYRARQAAIPWVDSWDRLKELDASLAARTPKTLWPQGDEQALGVENCMRVYPHYQNTGGFFITVLEKRGDVNAESQSAGILRAAKAMDEGTSAPPQYATVGGSHKRALSPPADGTAETSDDGSKRVKVDESGEASESKAAAAEDVPDAPTTHVKPDNHAADRLAKLRAKHKTDQGYGLPGGTPFKEDPFTYVSTANDQSRSIHDFFKFSNEFPSRNLLVRNGDGLPLRTIYLTSTTVRALLSGGGPGVDKHKAMNPLKLRLLNAGVKAFARQDTNKSGELPCKWRIVSDGLAPVRAYLREENIVSGELSDVAFLLSEYYPTLDSLPAGPFKERLQAKPLGSHVMVVKPSQYEGADLKESIDIPLWRAAASANLMLDKSLRTAMSNRIFGYDLSAEAKKKADAHKEMRDQQRAAKAAAEGGEGGEVEASAEAEAEKEAEVGQQAVELEVREEQGEDAV